MLHGKACTDMALQAISEHVHQVVAIPDSNYNWEAAAITAPVTVPDSETDDHCNSSTYQVKIQVIEPQV